MRTLGGEIRSHEKIVSHYHDVECCLLDPEAGDEELGSGTRARPGVSQSPAGLPRSSRTVLQKSEWRNWMEAWRKDIRPVSCPP